MIDYADFATAARAVIDPTTSAADLATIAELQPGLWAQIAGHPAAYPDLLDWLDSVGDTSVKVALAARQNYIPAPAGANRAAEGQPTELWSATQSWAAEQYPPAAPTAYPESTAYPAPAAHPAHTARPAPTRVPTTPTKLLPDVPEPTPFLKSRKGRITLIAGAAVILLVIIALVVAMNMSSEQGNADGEFDIVVAAYQQAQTELTAQLETAQAAADAADPDMLDDATTLENLNTKIAEARPNASAPVPVKGSTNEEVRSQTSALLALTQTMQQQTSDLGRATDTLHASAVLWAKSALTTAIANANITYDQFSYTTDKDALANLKAQIEAAQQVLSSLEQLDPNTVTTVATDAMTSLADAETAVADTAPTRCGDVTLPAGVNPMACGPVPDNAISLANVPQWGAMFETPSHNIGCYPTDSGIICEVAKHSWKIPSKLMKECQADNALQVDCDDSMLAITPDGEIAIVAHGDVGQWAAAKMENVKIPVLNYGKVIDYSPIACLSADEALTCWNIYTHHGFKVSASKFTYW